MKSSSILVAATLAVLSAGVTAAPIAFDFKDPKGVNNAVFLLDAPLESINGTATGVSGTVHFDPANPGGVQGRIVVDARSLHVPNPVMKEHMHGAQWMNSEAHPEISFEALRAANVKTDGDRVTADVTGRFTLRGVTRELTVPVTFTYLKDRLGARSNGQMQGDLLVIRSNFTIKRSDFGINPGAPQDKVSDEVRLTLSLAGMAPRK